MTTKDDQGDIDRIDGVFLGGRPTLLQSTDEATMSPWTTITIIVFATGVVAFVVTPADPISHVLGWFVLAVISLGVYAVLRKLRPAKQDRQEEEWRNPSDDRSL